MLYTNLKHIESAADYSKVISENENVVLICGNMDPLSVQTYHIAETMLKKYTHVQFFDIEHADPESYEVRNLLQLNNTEIPSVIFYRNGIAVYVTHGNPTRDQLRGFLDKQYGTKPKNSFSNSNLL